jgi:hypothetical protein
LQCYASCTKSVLRISSNSHLEFLSSNEDSTAGAAYGMVALLTYMTCRSPTTSAGPATYTWYGELIVSTQPVAPLNN